MAVAKLRDVDRRADPRTRAMAAARALAESGGYDAVQIRDVVRMTGLSSATIYRHFSSKNHLIAAVRVEWIRRLEEFDPTRFGTTALEQVAGLLHATCMAFAREPKLGAATVLAMGSSDQGVRECRDSANAIVFGILRDIVADEPIDTETFLNLLGVAWEGSLFAWVHGELGIDEVEQMLTRCARVLFDGVGTPVRTSRARKRPARR